MSEPVKPADSAESESFSSQAELESPGLIREFIEFLGENKKWWLTPIILVLGLVGVLVILGSTAAAPFIYTLF